MCFVSSLFSLVFSIQSYMNQVVLNIWSCLTFAFEYVLFFRSPILIYCGGFWFITGLYMLLQIENVFFFCFWLIWKWIPCNFCWDMTISMALEIGFWVTFFLKFLSCCFSCHGLRLKLISFASDIFLYMVSFISSEDGTGLTLYSFIYFHGEVFASCAPSPSEIELVELLFFHLFCFWNKDTFFKSSLTFCSFTKIYSSTFMLVF